MGNRYKEVLMTYLRRPFSSWQVAAWLAFAAWSVFSNGGGMPGHIGSGSIYSGVFFFSGLLWLHLREHMVHPRRKLVPEFIRSPVIIFLAVSLPVVAIPPLILATEHISRNGLYFSLSAYVFGLVGWAVAGNTWLVIILSLGTFLGPLEYLNLLNVAPQSGDGFVALWLLGCGLGASIWAILRLSRIVEGERGYGRMNDESLNFEDISHSVGRFVRSLLGPSPSVKHSREQSREQHSREPKAADQICYGPPMVLGGTIRESLRRWQHMGMLAASLLSALFLLCFAVSIIFGGFAHSASGITQDFSAAVPFAAFWPAAVVAVRWQQAWPCITVESLRPESRATFAQGIFLAIAAQILLAWLIFAGSTLLASAIAGLGLSGMEPLASGLLATLLIQPLAYTALCWLLPYGTSAWMFFMVPLAFAMLGLETITIFLGVSLAIGLAAICMLLGLILVPFVYRRWMNLEMG